MTALEKAAMAALTASHQHTGGTADPDLLWSVVGESARELYTAIARAVLMAVREPDDAWIMNQPTLRLDDQDAIGAYIDAILNEGKP